MKQNWMKIREMRTTNYENGFKNVHESIFRSYHILGEVKRLLELKAPYTIILEIIAFLEGDEE